MKRLNQFILIILFMAFITYFGLAIIFEPDKATSFHENRSLAQRPVVDFSSMAKGDFTKKFEAYVTDQFLYRDQWVKSYLKWQMLTDRTWILDYYITADDWIFPKPVPYIATESIEISIERLKQLNQFAQEKEKELYFFFLPDRKVVLDIDYPKSAGPNYSKTNKEIFVSKLPDNHLQFIDVTAEWAKEYTVEQFPQFFFKTDHHWNGKGALLGYEVIMNSLIERSAYLSGEQFQPDQYELVCLDDKVFMGGYNKQLYGMVDPSEEESCYTAGGNIHPERWTMYNGELDKRVEIPFAAFYGKGEHSAEPVIDYSELYSTDAAQIHIINPDSPTQTKALFIKDSYANPLLPSIAEHFYQTTFYDLRHNPGVNLYDYIEKYDFDMIVFLYNDSNIFSSMFQFKPE